MAEDLGLAAAQEGLTPEEIPVIVSGAGHDGLAMAEVSKVRQSPATHVSVRLLP